MLNDRARICVGVFYSSRAILGSQSTGAGVYETAVAEIFDSIMSTDGIQVIHYVPARARPRTPVGHHPERDVRSFRSGFLERALSFAPYSFLSRVVELLGLTPTARRLAKDGVDLVYFTSPSPIALRLPNIPYVFTVWDLGHRELPGFSETWGRPEWLSREQTYRIGIGRASSVLVDSDTTGEKLERLYGLSQTRRLTTGLLSVVEQETSDAPEIQSPYIIYPAAQWPHKNHRTLLRAFGQLEAEFPSLRLILTGIDAGNGANVRQEIQHLGLEPRVVCLGFVGRKRLLSLIKFSTALVMPSLLGPTNLPPLEALQLGVPAIVSDAHSFGRVIDKHLIFVPAMDEKKWAESIAAVIRNPVKQPPLEASLSAATKEHRKLLAKLEDELRTAGRLKEHGR